VMGPASGEARRKVRGKRVAVGVELKGSAQHGVT